MLKSPYDMIEVQIGSELVYARPIEWDTDPIDNEGKINDDEFIMPTKYETTCPNCGNMVHFKNGLCSVKCLECKVGDDLSNDVPNMVIIDPFCIPGEFEPVLI